MERLCVFCAYFSWDNPGIGPAYSEYTGGDPEGGATCKKCHFTKKRPYDEDDMRELFLTATSCQDYYPPTARGPK